MPRRIASSIALTAIVLAPSVFSLHLISFLHAKELLYAIAALALSMLGLFFPPQARMPRWSIALCTWLLAMTAISLVMGNPWHAPLEKMTHALLVIAFFAIVIRALPAGDAPQLIRCALLLSGVLAGALGLLQYAHVINYFLPVFPSYDQRMYSVFGNQDLLGGYMALTLPLAFGLLVNGERHEKVAAACALPVLCAALLLSQSRSAWLAAVVAIAVYLMVAEFHLANSLPDDHRRKHQLVIHVLTSGGLLLAAVATPWWIPRVAASFSAADTGGTLRLWFYAGTRHMFLAHPWLGVGFGEFGVNSPAHMDAVLHEPGGSGFAHNDLLVDHAHCDPLETLAETGIAGIGLLIVLLGASLRREPSRTIRWPEFTSVTALAIFSCLNPALQSAPHALAGMLCLHSARQAKESQETPWRYAAYSPLGMAMLVCAWLFLTFVPSVLTRS